MLIKQSTINIAMGITFLTMSVLLGSGIYYLKQANTEYKQAVLKQAKFKQLGINLADASDYLTAEAQKFSVTTNIKHLNNYWEEINITRTRDNVLKQLKKLDASQQEFELLDRAKFNSDALVATETRSMRLVLEVLDYQESEMPAPVAAWELSAEDKKLTDEEKLRVAREIMFDDKYHADKDLIMNPIEKFQQLSNRNASNALKIAKRHSQQAEKTLFIIAILIPIGMGLILSIFRLKVSIPISRYTETLHQHETKHDQDNRLNLEPAGTFELITLANAFNQQINTNRKLIAESQQASQELAEQNWQKTGQTQLNEKLRGEQNIETLAKNVIDFITSYSNSDLGSIYLYRIDEPPYLEQVANYGYVPTEDIPRQFALGEGLVGQAALDQKILFRDPLEHELQVIRQSSFCEAVPRHIMFLPFFYEQQLKGVIEIASYYSYTEKQQDFLLQSMTSIGIAISSAESRQKMQVLLKQSQTQSQQLTLQQQELQNINKELQKQQEELQSANEELQVQQEELRQANEELEIRSRDLEQQKEAIRSKNAALETIKEDIEQKAYELELASKYKSEFLANMSHELRTPLNAILVLGQMLSENDEGNLTEEQIDFAQTIHSAGSDLLNLINEILDLSKIEAGKIEIHVEPFSLPDLIHHSIEGKFKALATKKQIEFMVEFEDRSQFDIELHSDPHRIKQIINNLLSNAVKFTEQGVVTLGVHYATQGEFPNMQSDKKYVAISVSDTGIGIPNSKQSKVFEAFRQADNKTNRKYGGTGLGLSISRRLAQLLGGDIYLDSQEGHGSTFTVLFQTNLSDSEQEIMPVDGNSKIQYIDDRASLNEEDKVLLLVEKHSQYSQALVDLIHQHGLKCIIANDGKTGLNLALMYQPMTILIDMSFAIVDNWLLLDNLKKRTNTQKIPINFLFSKNMVENQLIQLANSDDLAQKFKNTQSILVVSDNKNCQQEINTLLSDYELHFGTEYQQCLNLLTEKTIDCMIIDVDSKQGEALSFLELMEQDSKLKMIILYAHRELTPIEQYFLKHCETSLLESDIEPNDKLLTRARSVLETISQNLAISNVNIIGHHNKKACLINKKVLLVDDDVRNINALETFLNKRQMKVEVAHHGKEALQVLSQHPDMDIILMDIMMPEMDGYETIQQIRLQKTFKETPIIALTAKAMKGDRNKCIDAGANDYLTKPIDTEKLLSLMRVWLYQ